MIFIVEIMQNFITRPYRTLTRILIFFIISLLFSCSAARLGYQHGETLSYWWLNSYVDFEDGQQAWVKQRIDAVFDWHHKTQLKDYAQLLTTAQKRLPHGVSQPELLHDFDEFQKRIIVLVERALPDLADLALSLRPRQIAHLEKKHATNNERFSKDYLRGDIEQQQRFRFKQTMQHAEFWFGSFSRAQETLIRKASDARPLNNAVLMADRLQCQRELIALLKKIQTEKPGRDAVISMLKDYISENYFDRTGSSAEQQAFFKASRESSAYLLMLIINLATPAQKAHAVGKAQQWIDDFNAAAALAS